MTAPYALTGFREGAFGIEALVALDGHPVTIVTGHAPYDVAPARSWAAHGQFLTWAESEHGTIEQAVQTLIDQRLMKHANGTHSSDQVVSLR